VARDRLAASLPDDSGPGDGLKVRITSEINKFVSKGKIARDDLLGVDNFNKTYNETIMANIKNLLLHFKNAGSGEHMTTLSFYRDMFTVFDDIFYNCLIMRYNIINCRIDR
jgi:hypothetical protein